MMTMMVIISRPLDTSHIQNFIFLGIPDEMDDDDDNDGISDSDEEENSEDDSSESSSNAAGLSLALVAIVLGRFA